MSALMVCLKTQFFIAAQFYTANGCAFSAISLCVALAIFAGTIYQQQRTINQNPCC